MAFPAIKCDIVMLICEAAQESGRNLRVCISIFWEFCFFIFEWENSYIYSIYHKNVKSHMADFGCDTWHKVGMFRDGRILSP